MSRGVLYIASGEKYVEMAAKSAATVNEHMPDIGTTLLTHDQDVSRSEFDTVKSLDKDDEAGFSPLKTDQSPYDRTLYLDADTYVTTPVYELFDILEDHHMAFTQSPGRLKVPGLPDPWIEFQNGVIAYKNCEATAEFFELWQRVYREMHEAGITDRQQPTFARAIYESDIDYFVLPREYNVRAPRFGYLVHEAKIVHGGTMAVPLEDLAETLNENDGRRVHWYYNHWNLKRDIKVLAEAECMYSIKNIMHMFVRSVKRSGVRHALRHSYLEIKQIFNS